MPPNDRPLHPGNACLPCRKRKAKCDGVRPICARCKRLGSDCHFDPPNKGTLAARSAAAQNASNHQQQQQLQQSSYQQQQVPLQSIPLKNSVSLSPRSQHSRSSSSSAALSPAFFSRLLSSLPSEQQLQHADSDALLNSGFEHPTLPMYTYHESWGGNPGDMGRISRQLVPEAYETCIARVTIESAVHDWDVRYDPPGMVADYLVRCFIPFRRQFAFFWDASRLARRASLTPSEPDALHPALLNAMYLAACQQTKGALANFEHMLLARTKAYLDEAFATLADPYRFTHVLAASLLLVGWYLKAGRTMEAESAISSTVHYAVACGLHDPNSMSSSPPSIMLPAPSPSDEPELSDRRNLWYGIALVDNALSLGSGRTKAAPEKSIASLDYLYNEAVNYMFTYPSSTAAQVRVRANALALGIWQLIQESKPHSRSPDMSNRVAMLSQMLTVFTNALPAIDALDGIAPGEAIALVNPDMVCAHMDIYAVTMLLMNSQMQMRGDPVSYDRMYKSACAIASICRHLRSSGRLEMIYASGGFEFGLHVACEVLLRDLLQMNGGPSSLEVERRAVMTQQSLEMLYSFEAELNPHFPSRKSLVRKIRGILSGTASFEILLS